MPLLRVHARAIAELIGYRHSRLLRRSGRGAARAALANLNCSWDCSRAILRAVEPSGCRLRKKSPEFTGGSRNPLGPLTAPPCRDLAASAPDPGHVTPKSLVLQLPDLDPIGLRAQHGNDIDAFRIPAQ